jgi:hypothetical protein
MALNWKKHDLPTRAQKEAKAKEQAEKDRLPDRVDKVEDAMCEQDAANEKRLTDIETALCSWNLTYKGLGSNCINNHMGQPY